VKRSGRFVLLGTFVNPIFVIASSFAFSREAKGRGGKQSRLFGKSSAILDRHASLAMTTPRHCEKAELTKQSRIVGKGLPTYGSLE